MRTLPALWICLLTSLGLLCPSPASAANWINWRGPTGSGSSPETNLPDKFNPTAAPGTPGSNLLWKQPYGCRSTPLLLKDRLYIINAAGKGESLGERVMCFDAKTGKVLWQYKFNVWHSNVVASRLGWTTLTADPETERIYAHGTQGMLLCFDRDGKVLWDRSLTEEYGRVSGYGGRIVSPIFDSGLVIVGMINGSWGNQARGANRFVAFDGANGEVVWWSDQTGQMHGTYYSSPVVAEINGERLLITGASDGTLLALKVRTGEKVWSYRFAAGSINCTPIVDGTLVYGTHGAENLDTSSQGRIVCVDASQVANGKPKLVWEYKGQTLKAGLASSALNNGKLYVPTDDARLYCFDAKTGKQLWRYAYGRLARGSPLCTDGKIYIFDVNAHFHILKPTDKGCEELQNVFFRNTGGPGFIECNGTPIAVNGCVYLANRDEIYCISKTGYHESLARSVKAPSPSNPTDTKPTHLQIVPGDVELVPGETVTFTVRLFNAKGEMVKEGVAAEWSLPVPPTPPTPPGAKPGAKPPSPPPALDGQVADGKLTVSKKSSQQGYVQATAMGITGRARVRVAPQIPYALNFQKVPVGAVPGGWVNAQGKFRVVELNGRRVLSKVNSNPAPPVARANAYITLPTTKEYTIQADLMGVRTNTTLPDLGVVNCRYRLQLDGKEDPGHPTEVRIISWEALPRINVSVPIGWKANVWYTVKMTVHVANGKAMVRGKVWPRGQPEPAKWTIELEDPCPNTEGSAALYGYASDILPGRPGAECYYDNVSITPNK